MEHSARQKGHKQELLVCARSNLAAELLSNFVIFQFLSIFKCLYSFQQKIAKVGPFSFESKHYELLLHTVRFCAVSRRHYEKLFWKLLFSRSKIGSKCSWVRIQPNPNFLNLFWRLWNWCISLKHQKGSYIYHKV